MTKFSDGFVWFLTIPNPDMTVWPTYAVGKHKLAHPYSISVTTQNPPQAFFVWIFDDSNPASKDEWKGAYYQCGVSPSIPPDDDNDE